MKKLASLLTINGLVPTYALMLLLITVMYVIIEKTLQVNIARLCCHIFYRWWYLGHRVNTMP